MKKTKEYQSKIGFQYHLFNSPYSLHRILEDFKSDHITLNEAIIQIREIPIEEKDTEEPDLKHGAQYRFNI